MRGARRCARLALALAAVLTVATARAEDRHVHALVIGSGDYAEAPGPGVSAFPDNDAAYLGAIIVARLFAASGVGTVIQLLGRDGDLVSREDILGAIADLAAAASADGGDGLLVVYVSAHGISEPLAHTLFVVPGDVVIDEGALDRSAPLRSVRDIEGMAAVAPSALALAAALDETGLPYLLLVDTCFETREGLDLEALERFDREIAATTRDVSDILRFMNLPRGPHPVVFSAPPGTLARPGLAPGGERRTYIAPLARRLSLLAEAARREGRSGLTLEEVVAGLTDPAADPDTKPAVTWYEGDPDRRVVLPLGTPEATPIDRRRGTAHAPRRCCVPAAAAPSWRISGSVALAGRGGDFVAGDAEVRGAFGPEDGWDWQVAANSLDVSAVLAGGHDVSISLGVPDERFAVRAYRDAERHGFETPGRPGLSVSLDGRGCNEVEGAFDVRHVAYGADGLPRALSVTLRQVCDGGPGALSGTLDVRIEPVR
jgi:hypothetical protein